jgi:hypothetical protein
MKFRHAFGLLAVTALVATTVLVVGQYNAPDARAAPGTTYVRTIGGFDFRSLDYRTFPQMVFNSGGGVFPSTNSGANLPPFRGLEASVDLPGGANVTRLDFYYRHCGGAGGPTFYFGAYAPYGGAFGYILNAAGAEADTSCTTTFTLTRSSTSLTRVTTLWRYVIGFDPLEFFSGAGTPPIFITGARVTYTCPTGCA